MNAETSPQCASPALSLLVGKGILEPFEQEWDSTTCYCFGDSDYAQAIYDELYGPIEMDHRGL